MFVTKVKYLNKPLNKIKPPRPGDLGIDIYADANIDMVPGDVTLVPTGIAIQPPTGYWFQIIDRSSVSKYAHVMAGVLDPNYRGEIFVRLKCNKASNKLPFFKINRGDKIAQLVLRKDNTGKILLLEVDKLDESIRGSAGFGSTGK